MFPPSRIACLTEETVETLYLLGEQDSIVGISGYVVRPPQARREKPHVSHFRGAHTHQIDRRLGFRLQGRRFDAIIAHSLHRRTNAGILSVLARSSIPTTPGQHLAAEGLCTNRS